MINLEKIEDAYIEELGIKVKRYLTKEEIEFISEEILKSDKPSERKYIKNILLCKIATDIPEEYDYEKNYEIMVCHNVFEYIRNEIVNVQDIESYIYKVESSPMLLKAFLKTIKEPVDQILEKLNDSVQKLEVSDIIKEIVKK